MDHKSNPVNWILSFLECGEVHASSFRIVGGEDTQFGGHPWMVGFFSYIFNGGILTNK